jgi:hypothetical protein
MHHQARAGKAAAASYAHRLRPVAASEQGQTFYTLRGCQMALSVQSFLMADAFGSGSLKDEVQCFKEYLCGEGSTVFQRSGWRTLIPWCCR